MKQRINKQVIISSYNLPLYCNGNISNNHNNHMDSMGIHPKVYLPIIEKKILSCPYCGIDYILLQEHLL